MGRQLSRTLARKKAKEINKLSRQLFMNTSNISARSGVLVSVKDIEAINKITAKWLKKLV